MKTQISCAAGDDSTPSSWQVDPGGIVVVLVAVVLVVELLVEVGNEERVFVTTDLKLTASLCPVVSQFLVSPFLPCTGGGLVFRPVGVQMHVKNDGKVCGVHLTHIESVLDGSEVVHVACPLDLLLSVWSRCDCVLCHYCWKCKWW